MQVKKKILLILSLLVYCLSFSNQTVLAGLSEASGRVYLYTPDGSTYPLPNVAVIKQSAVGSITVRVNSNGNGYYYLGVDPNRDGYSDPNGTDPYEPGQFSFSCENNNLIHSCYNFQSNNCPASDQDLFDWRGPVTQSYCGFGCHEAPNYWTAFFPTGYSFNSTGVRFDSAVNTGHWQAYGGSSVHNCHSSQNGKNAYNSGQTIYFSDETHMPFNVGNYFCKEGDNMSFFTGYNFYFVVDPYCGDGVVNGSESCDDGNSSNLDTCSNNCTKTYCGDGIIQWSGNGYGVLEKCDDGNTNNGDGCNSNCQNEPTPTNSPTVTPTLTTTPTPTNSPTPTNTPSPLPTLVVNVKSPDGQNINMHKIDTQVREELAGVYSDTYLDTCSNTYTCISEYDQAALVTLVGESLYGVGGKISWNPSDNYEVIGVTTAPQTTIVENNNNAANNEYYALMQPWNTGKREMTFIVTTPVPVKSGGFYNDETAVPAGMGLDASKNCVGSDTVPVELSGATLRFVKNGNTTTTNINSSSNYSLQLPEYCPGNSGCYEAFLDLPQNMDPANTWVCQCNQGDGSNPYQCHYSNVKMSKNNNEPLNFYLKNVNLGNYAWMQTIGGNVLASANSGNAVDVDIPTSDICTGSCVSAFILSQDDGVNAIADSAGFVLTGGGDVELDGSDIHTSGDRTSAINANAKDTKVRKENYDYFYERIDESVVTLANNNKPVNGGTYIKNGDLTLKSNNTWEVTSGQSYLVFVDGNLIIDGVTSQESNPVTKVENGGTLVFVVSGDVIINENVGYADPATSYTAEANVEGVFIADGKLRVKGYQNTASADLKLIAEGTYVGWSGVEMARDYDDGMLGRLNNNSNPVVVWKFRPDFITSLPKELKFIEKTWTQTTKNSY